MTVDHQQGAETAQQGEIAAEPLVRQVGAVMYATGRRVRDQYVERPPVAAAGSSKEEGPGATSGSRTSPSSY